MIIFVGLSSYKSYSLINPEIISLKAVRFLTHKEIFIEVVSFRLNISVILSNGRRFADKLRITQIFSECMYQFTQVKVIGRLSDCVQSYHSFRFIRQCIIKNNVVNCYM